MPKFRVTAPDGAVYEVNAPEGATEQQAINYIRSQHNPSTQQRMIASPIGAVVHGMQSGVDGLAEYAPWALGALTGGFGAAPNPVSKYFFDESSRVRGINKQHQDYYDQARAVTGRQGFDLGNFVGQVASPTNIALATAGAPPATTLGRIAYGAGMGGLGAAMSPVPQSVPDSKFGAEKGTQTALGMATGAVVTPIAGKAIDLLGRATDRVLNAIGGRFRKINEAAIYDRLRFELAKEEIDIGQIPEGIRKKVVADVADALRSGKKVDGAAILRKIDFQQFGVPGTQGQITRDPQQWMKEFNLRSVEGAGEPLANQAGAVVSRARGNMNAMGGATPATEYDAGNKLSGILKGKDAAMLGAIDRAYQGARDSAGRYAQLNVGQFSKLANDAIDENMLGVVLKKKAPEALQYLNDVSTGKIPLNVNTATMLRQRLGGIAQDLRDANQSQAALGVKHIIDALDATDLMGATGSTLPVIPGAPTGPSSQARQAFDRARALAKARFDAMRANPALKAAADGKINPDKFVSQYVMGAKNTNELGALAKDLGDGGRQIVKEQIAKQLKRQAFGSGAAGEVNKSMAIERYKNALDKIGRRRLSMFFSPEEVDDLYRIARVTTYTETAPPGVTPNRAGTAAAVFNMLQKLQGVPFAVPTIRGIANQAATGRALSANVPSEPLPIITPALQNLLGTVPLGVGISQASSASQ